MLKELMKNTIQLTIPEIIEYDFPMDEPFFLKIIHEGTAYEFVIRLSSDNDRLICFGSGAHPRNSKTSKGELIKPPYFDRWSWYEFVDESIIAYADPSFYYDDRITLGWFVGDETWYLEVVGNIIDNIAQNRKIANENILFYGSSGGGFASIGLATLLKGSKTIVNNSSFSIRDITDWHYEYLLGILKNKLNLSEEELLDKLKHRIDLIELFKYKNYIPDITYYVNSYSKADLERCNGFVNNVISLQKDNTLDVHYYYEEDPESEGHGPMDFGKTLNTIKTFNNPKYEESIEENNILKQRVKELKKITKKNKKLKKQLKQIKNSKSWKLTEPLRKLKQLLKK